MSEHNLIKRPFMAWMEEKAFKDIKEEWEKEQMRKRAKAIRDIEVLPKNKIYSVIIKYAWENDNTSITGILIDHRDERNDEAPIDLPIEYYRAVEEYVYCFWDEWGMGNNGQTKIDLEKKRVRIKNEARDKVRWRNIYLTEENNDEENNDE